MRQLKYILFGVALTLTSLPILGQDLPCGTGGGHSDKQMRITSDLTDTNRPLDINARKADFKHTKFRFKVVVHGFRKVATDDSSVDLDNISKEEIVGLIQELNKAFDPVNFEFVLCMVNYISVPDHNFTFKINYKRTAHETLYCDGNDVPKHINIYIPNTVSDGEREIGGRADFPEYDRLYNNLPIGTRIIIGKGSTAAKTLIHEMGHFFNLYHTSETRNGLEKADGSNCSTTGDLLCDTPADPYPSSSSKLYFDNNCKYTGPSKDLWGTSYSPLTDNYMSVNPQLCRKKFSDDQIYRMHNHGLVDRNDMVIPYQSSFDYVIKNNKFYPPFAEVSVNTVASSILTSASNISESSDIKYYADEKIILKTGFTVKKGSKFQAKRIDFCDMPQRKPGVILLNPTNIAESKLSEANNPEVETEVNKVTVFPNPNNGNGTLTYHAGYAVNVKISIYNVLGNEIHSINNTSMNEGPQSVEFDLSGLPAGIYSAVVEGEGKVYSTQFIIVK